MLNKRHVEFLFQLFIVVVWNFELYMLPLALLLLLVWNFFFCSSRETAETVSKQRQAIILMNLCFPYMFECLLLCFLLQSMEAMFEWEDEEEDKEDKVVINQPYVHVQHRTVFGLNVLKL